MTHDAAETVLGGVKPSFIAP